MEIHIHTRGEKEGSWTYGGGEEENGRWETGAGWRTGWFIMVLAFWAVLTDFHNQDFLTLLNYMLVPEIVIGDSEPVPDSFGLWVLGMAWLG